MSISVDEKPSLHEGINSPSPVSRVLAFGYYDGPTEGVLQLGEHGEVYRFDLLEEFSGQGPDETDLRRFGLRPLTPGALQVLLDVISPYCPPVRPSWRVWIPSWHELPTGTKAEVDAKVDQLLGQAGPLTWIVETADLLGTLQAVRARYQG